MEAEKTWKQTGADQDANFLPVVSDLCGDNRVTYAVMKAMLRTGFGARVPALLTPIIAADNAPDMVPGVFVLNVQATGRSGRDVYLNSEIDYRDARNLSVRILSRAQKELRKKYGDDYEAALKGNTIEVMGWVRRAKISFLSNGKDTGKFYYQTHVVMYSADQLQRLEDRPAPPVPHEKLEDRDVKT